MKKILILIMCFVLISPFSFSSKVFANEYYKDKVFNIYDEENNLLLQTQNTQIGDILINKNFERYEVIFVDEENYFAICKYLDTIPKPKITKKQLSNVNALNYQKQIAMYCTHNDESYELGDNTSSVYGKGGIHDIAKLLCKELQLEGVNVIFDESLHIPHDTNAYKRSSVTAKELLNDYSLDALFDIHRDGASRSLYVNKTDGKERCMVRIVVGQANKNKEKNLEFALYLMSVSEIICPWLFLDIYYAKGDYNQNLTNKSLLFEMGSHLVEKSLVEETVPYLAKVIYTGLYNTQINSDGELTIGKTENKEDNTLNDYFEEDNKLNVNTNTNVGNENNLVLRKNHSGIILVVAVIVSIVFLVVPLVVFCLVHREK